MAGNKMIVTLLLITAASLVITGCSDSDDNNPVAVTPPPVVDTAPPAVPFNLDASFDSASGTATISWGVNNVDTDLVGYVVMREAGGEETFLISEPTLVQSVEDADPAYGTSTYYVIAVDTSANESAYATVILARPQSHQPDISMQ